MVAVVVEADGAVVGGDTVERNDAVYARAANLTVPDRLGAAGAAGLLGDSDGQEEVL
jgi:hypothetical protein